MVMAIRAVSQCASCVVLVTWWEHLGMISGCQGEELHSKPTIRLVPLFASVAQICPWYVIVWRGSLG